MQSEQGNPSDEIVYVGLRDDVVAEVGAFNPVEFDVATKREAKYLVFSKQFQNTEWFPSRYDAMEAAEYIVANSPGAKIICVS